MGQFGDLSPSGSVALGVVVGLMSTSVQSLGLTLQRKSHILEDEKDSHFVRRPPHRRRRWQLGMLMFVVSNLLGSTIQITTLPLPVLSTLQASGLVFNSICATVILGEPFTRWSLVGTILVCVGAVLIATFGAMKEPAHTLDQLLDLLGRRPFILWMIGQAVLVIAIIGASKLVRIMSPRAVNSPRTRLWRGMAYGAVSGILSAHSLLVAKSAVELLVRTIVDRVNQFNRWQSWVTLLGLVALALCQLYYLHRGLKLVSTSILYPFVFCIYNIIAILDGLIYFRQTSKLSLLHALLIALGTVILLAGVFALSWRLTDNETSPPAGQNALTPGLGFVDDVTDDEHDRIDASPTTDAESQPLLPSNPSTPRPRSLHSHNNATNSFRHSSATEAAEIWDELEDTSPRFESTPRHRRRSTTALHLHSPGAGHNPHGGPGASGSGSVSASGSRHDLNRVNERTYLLRTNTLGPYRDRWRRRKSLFTPSHPLGRTNGRLGPNASLHTLSFASAPGPHDTTTRHASASASTNYSIQSILPSFSSPSLAWLVPIPQRLRWWKRRRRDGDEEAEGRERQASHPQRDKNGDGDRNGGGDPDGEEREEGEEEGEEGDDRAGPSSALLS